MLIFYIENNFRLKTKSVTSIFNQYFKIMEVTCNLQYTLYQVTTFDPSSLYLNSLNINFIFYAVCTTLVYNAR